MALIEIGRDEKNNPITIEYHPAWSMKDFTGWWWQQRALPAPGTIIYSSVFENENLDAEIFPAEMKGVSFYFCNLNNIIIPDGNFIHESCSRIRFEVQNDLRDWQVDHKNNPVKVLNEKYWAMKGFSIDPKDIPAEEISHIDLAPKAEEVKI